MSSKRIAVLLDENSGYFEHSIFVMRFLVQAWREKGHTVELIRGVKRFVPADVIIPHIDLTVLPEEYVAFMQQYPRIVNRHIIDISKSKISTNKLKQNDAYSGPVIVKTERNCGGNSERAARKANRSIASIPGEIVRKVVRCFRGERPTPWERIECLQSGEYPVFASLSDVPAGVFRNPLLIVEKFLPEQHGDDYILRYFSFFGHIESARLLRSKSRIVKGRCTHLREEIPVPPELSARRRQMGFDFGRFDYVEHDGRPVLFDANKTPVVSSVERGMNIARRLCEGISSILESPPLEQIHTGSTAVS